MNEMNILTLNGEQYEVADQKAREGKLDKEPIPMATDKDTQAVRRKPDGSLWTKAGGGGGAGGAVDSVNGRTGDVILKLGDLDGDVSHRTVTDSEKTEWNGKLDKATIGEAKLTDTQEVHLTPEGKLVTRPTGGGGGAVDSVNGKTGDVFLRLRDLDGDISHRTVTDTQIVGWDNKQDAGDYATTADLDGKLDKSPIGAATPDDTQEVHLTPEGKLVTAPSGGGGGIPVTLTAITNSGATVTATDGVTTLVQEAPEGTAKFHLPNAGEWTATAEKEGESSKPVTVDVVDSFTVDAPILPKTNIYGAQWDGTASTKWARTDAAVGFTDPVPAVNNGTGSSPFDTIMPWKGMTRVSDPAAGELVKIPKFYYKWTAAGNGLKLQISEVKLDETWFISPAHMDRGDGHGERDVVYVGRYHCADDYKSKTGVYPKTEIARATARTKIHALGEDIWQWDWHMHMTIWMLYLVEFADWDCQTVISRGGGEGYLVPVGKSDRISYCTGTPYLDKTTFGSGVQYRYIEGLWDNIFDWVDGCYYNYEGLNIINNPNQFSDNANGSPTGTLADSGYPSKFAIKEINGFQVIYPIASGGSNKTYTCDEWGAYTRYNLIYIGGAYNQGLDYGIGRVNSTDRQTKMASTRLMKLPNA